MRLVSNDWLVKTPFDNKLEELFFFNQEPYITFIFMFDPITRLDVFSSSLMFNMLTFPPDALHYRLHGNTKKLKQVLQITLTVFAIWILSSAILFIVANADVDNAFCSQIKFHARLQGDVVLTLLYSRIPRPQTIF